MNIFFILGGIALYLGIAIWATRFVARLDYTLNDAFKPMTLDDAIMFMMFTFTPFSILIIIFALFLKLESMELDRFYGRICGWLREKVISLAGWMFLPRKKDVITQAEKR